MTIVHTLFLTKNNLYCFSVYNGDEYDCCYITRVAGTEIEFSELNRKRVEAVRSLQKRINFPSDNDLVNAIDYNVVGNCQFILRDIHISHKIHGKSIAEFKGKSTKRKVKMTRNDIKCEVLESIMGEYSNIHLDIDIMHVNKIVYFTAISQHI